MESKIFIAHDYSCFLQISVISKSQANIFKIVAAFLHLLSNADEDDQTYLVKQFWKDTYFSDHIQNVLFHFQ